MKKIAGFILLAAIAAFLVQCGGGGGGGQKNYPRFQAGDNEIIEFSFAASKNSSANLTSDITGVIEGDAVSIQVPYNIALGSLVADFVTNSTEVLVNGVKQVSGATANDFGASLTYTVVAENGDESIYTVTVTKAPSPEKRIVAFSLNGTAGTIDEEAGTIAVSMPPRSGVTSIAAVFSALGASVKVGDAAQVSGVSANDFTAPVTYTVTAADGSSRGYHVTATIQPSPLNDISIFSFRKDDNPELARDVAGVITLSDIIVVLPFGSTRDGLKAYYETEGADVTVNGVTQQPGVTENDFSDFLTYAVKAENGDSRDYLVAVSVAKSDARAITQFYLDGEKGAIDEGAGTISIPFAATRNLGALKAAFTTTGVSVKVGSVIQESGITVNDFSSPVDYLVVADNGATKTYAVTAEKKADITGIWNFESAPDGYTVNGTTQVDGLSGKALQFNGTTDYVLVPDSDDLTLDRAGSVEAVVKVIAHRPYAGIVHKGVLTDFSDETYSLQFWGSDGTLRFSIFNDKGEYLYIESTQKLSTEKWYHLVATWDEDKISLYINGTLEVSTNNTIGAVRDSAGGLVIGAQLDRKYNSSYGNIGFNGIIDRVAVHKRSLAEWEISAMFLDLNTEVGGAFTAYLLSAAARNIRVIVIALFIVMLALGALYLYNRRTAGVER